MTPEERDIISRFVARVGGAQQGSSGGSSVPATQQALPPIDPDADRFIADQFQAYPAARYRITQMAFVQEAALAEAQNRIKRLEYELQQVQQQARSGPGQARGGFFSGLFGGGQQAQAGGPGYQPQYAPPPPQAAYPPGYQPGMFRSGGSGFLGSALTTAAGVAGGVLAADALTSMFSGPHMGGGFGGGFGGGGFGGGEVVNETVVNNYGDAGNNPWAGGGADPGAGSDWAGGSGGADPWAGGGAAPDSGGWAGGDSGGGDAGGDAGGASGGWDDNSGGGWDDNSGGGDGGF